MVGEVDFSQLRVPDIGAAFQQGYQQKRKQNALAAYAQNPDNPQALNALAEFNPEFVVQAKKLQLQEQQAKAKQAQEASIAHIQQLGRLLNHARDETSYQQARAAAAQLPGMDMSQIPANYDPNWVNQQKLVLSAIEKDGGQALSNYGKIAMDRGLQPGTPEFAQFVTQAWEADQVKTIPYTQGGGVAGYNTATGAVNTIIQPNPGGYQTGAPVGGGFKEGQTATNPQTGEKVQFRGGQWVPMGGGSGNATGGFQP